MFSLRSLSTAAAVAVTSCSAETQAPALTTGFVPVFATPFSNVNLSFVNNASVPATNVELLVTVDGATSRIDTAGTFSPGTRIDRSTSAIPAYLNASDVTCSIAKVDFKDGTSWNALAALPRTTASR